MSGLFGKISSVISLLLMSSTCVPSIGILSFNLSSGILFPISLNISFLLMVMVGMLSHPYFHFLHLLEVVFVEFAKVVDVPVVDDDSSQAKAPGKDWCFFS